MASLLLLPLLLVTANNYGAVQSENSCPSNPCRHRARCVENPPYGVKCVCSPGWRGKLCDKPRKTSCHEPSTIQDGFVKAEGPKYAIYGCKKGYNIIGDRIILCKNGSWLGRAPTCRLNRRQIVCGRPPDLPNGYYEPTKIRYAIGSTVKYICNDNTHYRLKRDPEVTCNENGEWSMRKRPRCTRRERCSDPGIPENGFRAGSLFLQGTQVRFSCDDGYEIVGSTALKCEYLCRSCSTVRWNDTVPACRKHDSLESLQRVAMNLRKHFIDKLSWNTSDSLARAGLSSGAGGLDLVFVFDSSGSVGRENFKKGIAFAKTIIDEFGISKSKTGTRVAIVTYSSTAKVIFNLKTNAMPSKEEGIAFLENLDYEAGGTATSYALNKTIEEIEPETRNSSKKALFLITDGRSNVGGDPSYEAIILRETLDFEIYAIGVTDSVDEQELRDIASEPFRTHVHLLEKFEDLTKLKELITAKGNDYSECGVAGDTQLRNDDAKEFDGYPAKAGAWPWLAAVYVKSNFRCGGVLIKKNWLLTGAHCFFQDGKVHPTDIIIRLGEHDRFKEEGTEQNIGAGRLFIHPNAARTRLEDDLALIRLEHRVKFSPYVRTACLPQPTDLFYVRPGKFGVVAGWGTSHKEIEKLGKSARRALHVVQQIQVKFRSNQQCRENAHNPATITDRVICAGNSSANEDACKGDRGSPLVVKRSDDRDSWAVVGISRWREGCATQEQDAVYTRIDKYMSWINKKINKRPRK